MFIGWEIGSMDILQSLFNFKEENYEENCILLKIYLHYQLKVWNHFFKMF